jgi:hypothetical protein
MNNLSKLLLVVLVLSIATIACGDKDWSTETIAAIDQEGTDHISDEVVEAATTVSKVMAILRGTDG